MLVLPLTVSDALGACLVEKALGDVSCEFVHLVKRDLWDSVIVFNDLMNFQRLELTSSYLRVS